MTRLKPIDVGGQIVLVIKARPMWFANSSLVRTQDPADFVVNLENAFRRRRDGNADQPEFEVAPKAFFALRSASSCALPIGDVLNVHNNAVRRRVTQSWRTTCQMARWCSSK